MAVASRANFGDLLDPAFRKIYSDKDRNLPVKYTEIYNVMSSTKNLEKDSSISGLAKLAEKGEGEAVTAEDIFQGFDVTYTHKTYAKKTTITKEMIADDQFRKVVESAQGLAVSLQRTTETSGADLFNNAFTAGGGGLSQFQSGGDALALFSTAHTRTDNSGSTLSNTTTSDLAEDSMEAALVAMRETLDDRGELISVMPDTMVVPPALEKEARILLETGGRTGTANNDVNVYKGRLNLVVWDYIGAAGGGSDTAWFILDKNTHRLNWFWRQRPDLTRNTDFDTKNVEFMLDARWSNGFADWRGTYGSQGDNS